MKLNKLPYGKHPVVLAFTKPNYLDLLKLKT